LSFIYLIIAYIYSIFGFLWTLIYLPLFIHARIKTIISRMLHSMHRSRPYSDITFIPCTNLDHHQPHTAFPPQAQDFSSKKDRICCFRSLLQIPYAASRLRPTSAARLQAFSSSSVTGIFPVSRLYTSIPEIRISNGHSPSQRKPILS